MADISAAFFILLIISIAFPAMLATWWLLFPSMITRARSASKKLSRTFWLGFVTLIVVTIPIIILMAMPFGPAKFLAWILLAVSLALSSIGSAGIAAHLGEQMKRAGTGFTPLGGFIRGAVILELAAFFPMLGWFFLWPLALITALGATAFALLNWMPLEKNQISSATATTPSSATSPISNL